MHLFLPTQKNQPLELEACVLSGEAASSSVEEKHGDAVQAMYVFSNIHNVPSSSLPPSPHPPGQKKISPQNCVCVCVGWEWGRQ